MPYQPVQALIATPGRSPQYLLPTWESSLAVFGVQTKGDVHIKFISATHNAHVVISLNAAEYGGESQMTVRSGDAAATVVSRDNASLSAHRYTYFAVFRKESLFALTRDGAVNPLLVYSNDSTEVDFFTCNIFQVWSRSTAKWDFLGEKYLGVPPGTVSRQPAVATEMHGLVKGLAERILAIDFFLDHVKVKLLPRPVQTQLTDVLDDLNPFFLILRFHGYDFLKSLKIIPTDNIMHARLFLSTLYSKYRKTQ